MSEMKELFRVLIDEQGYVCFNCDDEIIDLSSDQIGTLREMASGAPVLIEATNHTHKHGAFAARVTHTKKVYEIRLGVSWEKVLDILDDAERSLSESGG